MVVDVQKLPRGSGSEVVNTLNDQDVPKVFHKAVVQGIQDSLNDGVLAGYPLVDVKVIVVGGSSHEVDSNELAYKIAAFEAVKDAVSHASPVLLEPFMRVEIETPDQYMGDIIGNMNARRGKVLNVEMRDDIRVIECQAPLSNMFGYSTQLRSLSQGRATFTMELLYYDEVPDSVTERILGTYGFRRPPQELAAG